MWWEKNKPVDNKPVIKQKEEKDPCRTLEKSEQERVIAFIKKKGKLIKDEVGSYQVKKDYFYASGNTEFTVQLFVGYHVYDSLHISHWIDGELVKIHLTEVGPWHLNARSLLKSQRKEEERLKRERQEKLNRAVP